MPANDRKPSAATRAPRAAGLLALALLAGCTAMLPRGSSDTLSPFDSYAQAQAAAERIGPFQTPVQQLWIPACAPASP
jgi:hypothetical protein